MNNNPAPAQEEKKKNWFQRHKIITGIIVVVVLLWLIGLASGPTSTPSTTSDGSGTPAKTEDQKTEKKTYGLNEEVPSSDVVWTVTKVTDRGNTLTESESRYSTIASKKTTSGRFIEVHVKVENKSSDLASITTPDLTDSKERNFTAATDVSEWLPEDKALLFLENLQPNLPKELAFMFEVPADAEGLKLKVGVFDPKFVDLGL